MPALHPDVKAQKGLVHYADELPTDSDDSLRLCSTSTRIGFGHRQSYCYAPGPVALDSSTLGKGCSDSN